ncbi:MAG TPA: hypothetical protein VG410_13405, partial [Solirubrobacteraceae bacterium]|nr:hypothetical protein [Solirubrobacteraceae bacterium]
MRRARMPLALLLAVAVLAEVASSALATPGALDPSFGRRGMVAEPYGEWVAAVAAAVQPDGKIVTVGEAELSDKRYALISTRMLRNGRLDPSYGSGGWVVLSFGGVGGGNAITILPNGEILLAGAARTAKKAPLGFAVVKLEPDGQLDKSFGNGGAAIVPIGTGAIVNAIGVRPDGKIVLGGTAELSYPRFAVVRLNPDGTLDRSFGDGGVVTLSEPGAAWGMGLRKDGSIVLAGTSTAGVGGGLYDLLTSVGLGGVARHLLAGAQYMAAALTPDGRLDPGFGQNGVVQFGIGTEALCTALAVQPDGGVVLAGSAFTTTGVSATVQLLPDGSLDHSFGVGGISYSPLYNPVNAVAAQPDGKLLVAATGPTVIRLGTNG